MMAAPKVGLDEIIRKSEMGAVNELTYEYALIDSLKTVKSLSTGLSKTERAILRNRVRDELIGQGVPEDIAKCSNRRRAWKRSI